MGTVLYSPARGETIHHNGAASVKEIAERRGDRFTFLQFDWDQTVDDWVRVVKEAYAACDPADTEIVGMSLGSVATLVATAAMKEQPKRICLLSLSARFGEDLPNLPPAHMRSYDETQRQAFARLSFEELAPLVRCPVLLMMGALEREAFPALATRVHKAAELLPNARLVIAQGAGHDLQHPGYQEALEGNL